MKPLRRLLSILLLAVFGLPIASPLFAQGAESDANVAVCCRRGGSHHCLSAMEMSESSSAGLKLKAPMERCPYAPASVASVHPDLFVPAISAAIYASVVSHPSGVAQTESKRRISSDRSRQKRGPPVSLFV
jgi:hypothetical protein